MSMDPYTILTKLFADNYAPHALLFSGSDVMGKKEAAINLARYLFHENPADFMECTRRAASCKSCALVLSKTHPDFTEIDELPISISQIRKLKERFAESPFLALWKVAILPDVEKMTPEAANCFLKVLEEPRGKALFMLFAKSRSSVLPTLASRTLEIRFPVKNALSHPSQNVAMSDAIRIFENGSLVEKFTFAKMYSLKNKGEVLALLDEWLMYLRQKVLEGEEKTQIGKKIFKLKQIFSTTNANPQLLLEELFLNYA